MDLYRRVRLACHLQGLSQREADLRFGILLETVKKILWHLEPPGYRCSHLPKRSKLDPFPVVFNLARSPSSPQGHLLCLRAGFWTAFLLIRKSGKFRRNP